MLPEALPWRSLLHSTLVGAAGTAAAAPSAQLARNQRLAPFSSHATTSVVAPTMSSRDHSAPRQLAHQQPLMAWSTRQPPVVTTAHLRSSTGRWRRRGSCGQSGGTRQRGVRQQACWHVRRAVSCTIMVGAGQGCV